MNLERSFELRDCLALSEKRLKIFKEIIKKMNDHNFNEQLDLYFRSNYRALERVSDEGLGYHDYEMIFLAKNLGENHASQISLEHSHSKLDKNLIRYRVDYKFCQHLYLLAKVSNNTRFRSWVIDKVESIISRNQPLNNIYFYSIILDLLLLGSDEQVYLDKIKTFNSKIKNHPFFEKYQHSFVIGQPLELGFKLHDPVISNVLDSEDQIDLVQEMISAANEQPDDPSFAEYIFRINGFTL